MTTGPRERETFSTNEPFHILWILYLCFLFMNAPLRSAPRNLTGTILWRFLNTANGNKYKLRSLCLASCNSVALYCVCVYVCSAILYGERFVFATIHYFITDMIMLFGTNYLMFHSQLLSRKRKINVFILVLCVY